jgi:hypothetical protein
MVIDRRQLVVLGMALMLGGSPVRSGAQGQQQGDEVLVQQHFPQWLIDESTADVSHGGPRPFRAFAYTAADLNGSGQSDFVVAAYSNGFSGAVVVLSGHGAAAVEIANPQFPQMSGSAPAVKAIDMNHDGRQEIVVSLTSARGVSADWVLQWDGTTLCSIGPTALDTNGNEDTVLNDADFIDFDGDGTLDIVNSMEFDAVDATAVDTFQVFKLLNGRFEAERTLNFFETFARIPPATERPSSMRPVKIERSFTIADASAGHLMTVVYEGEPGRQEIRSAEITLNGIVVAAPNIFAQHERVVTMPVALRPTNTLSIDIRGPRGSRMSIGIGPE